MEIKATDKIIDKVKENPELKEKILEYSIDLEKLSDPWVFNLVANLATFADLAEQTGKDIDDFLNYLNKGIKENKSNIEEENQAPDWVKSNSFETIDARKLSGFFLKDILAKESSLKSGVGLKVIQNFYAAPLITLMESKGYKSYSRKIAKDLFYFYFLKEEEKLENVNVITNGKPKMVIQSATPVVYPVLLKLINSEEVRKNIEVTEYKVWEETEKHLGWIVNGKADLSFSAILAMSNLTNNKDIVTLTSVAVWDNFYILTRGYKAEKWEDLKDHEIYMPLFKNAPPAKVTHYIMRELGYNPEAFKFVYGEPFGRPEEIYKNLVERKIDTALLREPEVSYALVNNPEISVAFSYNELWTHIRPGSQGLPNAGVVFKKEWLEKYPDEANLLMREIENAVNWVKANPKEAAELSYKEMGHSYEEVYKFLNRVRFENIPANDVETEIVEYLSLIEGEERAKLAVSKMLSQNRRAEIILE